jgi:hypothetical protein
MKRIIVFAILCIALTACELFVIGTKKKPVVEINQNSAIGTVLLFKAKIDSSNIQDASHIIKKQDGTDYLAIEKYDLIDDIELLSRVIAKKPVTEYMIDTLSPESCSVKIVFDYIKKYKFETRKISELWFITGFKKN